MFSFSGADGEPFTFYPVFPCNEIHSEDVSVAALCYRRRRFEAVLVGLAATDPDFIEEYRVWPARGTTEQRARPSTVKW